VRPFFLSFEVMLMRLPFALLILSVALSGCGSPNDPGVGGVTKAEAEQLNEAAEELNQDGPPPSVVQNAPPQAGAPPKK
jgi:predicted small secreted protein